MYSVEVYKPGIATNHLIWQEDGYCTVGEAENAILDVLSSTRVSDNGEKNIPNTDCIGYVINENGNTVSKKHITRRIKL